MEFDILQLFPLIRTVLAGALVLLLHAFSFPALFEVGGVDVLGWIGFVLLTIPPAWFAMFVSQPIGNIVRYLSAVVTPGTFETLSPTINSLEL